jgi:hypothetical protein
MAARLFRLNTKIGIDISYIEMDMRNPLGRSTALQVHDRL